MIRDPTTELESHLKALGVAPGASWDEVRLAYRRAVREWHPDRRGAADSSAAAAAENIRRITGAYRALAHYYRRHGSLPGAAKAAESSRVPFRRRVRLTVPGANIPLNLLWIAMAVFSTIAGILWLADGLPGEGAPENEAPEARTMRHPRSIPTLPEHAEPRESPDDPAHVPPFAPTGSEGYVPPDMNYARER